MDEYSVEGGFTGRDSAKYFGIGRGKNLLKIQEDFMNKVLDHQMAKRAIRPQKCKEASKKFMKTVLQGVPGRRRLRGENVYSFMKYRSAAAWAEDGGTEPYLCAPCATTDYSYPGSGRASGNLVHPRWAAECSKCGKKNPFHRKKKVVFEVPSPPSWLAPVPPAPPPSPCDEGPVGDEGPESSNGRWSGKWLRRLGLTK